MQMACALGVAQADDPPAAFDVAANAEPSLRIACAEKLADRIYGKATQVAEVNVEARSDVVQALQALAKREQRTIDVVPVDVVAVPTT